MSAARPRRRRYQGEDILWLEHSPRRRWKRDSKNALSDRFKPPADPCEVKCLHCGLTYNSQQMIWGTKEGVRSLGPLWWCATPLCDGAGFGFDIYTHKPEVES